MPRVCYDSFMIKISDALAHAHDLPKGGVLHGHRITVEGFYFAFDNGEKVRRKYSEEFKLEPAEHRVHGHGALGHILSDAKLAERLSEKDKNFRGIQTHVITRHENLTEEFVKTVPIEEDEQAE